MPGESLMCVWVAAHSLNPGTSDRKLTKKGLHGLVAQLSELSTVSYSRTKFDESFKTDDDVSISSFKQYLFEVLGEIESFQCSLQEEVENRCWELCKSLFPGQSLCESSVRKLWEITNRLFDIDTFPPVVSQEVVDWFGDKASAHLGKNWKGTGIQCNKTYTFASFLDKLMTDLFNNETKDSVTRCIDKLHSWLVCEIMKSGWLYKRFKKQANWTNWRKAWGVLTADRLTFYDNPGLVETNKKRREFILTGSKLEILPPYWGVIYKLQGRFRLSALWYQEVEVATKEYEPRQSWTKHIEQTLDANRDKTTPTQRLLKVPWAGFKKHNEELDRSNSKLNKSEKGETDNTEVIVPEEALSVTRMRKFDKISVTTPTTGSDDESFDNSDNSNLITANNDKMKTVFMMIDKDGNGKIDEDEFKEFMTKLGLKVSVKEIKMIYECIAKNNNSFVTFQEFATFFANVVLDETVAGEAETKLIGAFLKADRDGSGTLNFKEFSEYVWDKKRSVLMNRLRDSFDHMDKRHHGQISYDQFRDFYKHRMALVADTEAYQKEGGLNAVDEKLKELYDKSDAAELATFVRDRWNTFSTLRRYGASGEVAMKGGHGMVDDIVPGEYSLLDLSLFSDLPPLVPKHTIAKGVKWKQSTIMGKSGKVIFPKDFDGKLLIETAMPEYIRYYGCSFADGNPLKISLLYRHGIQDFTYENIYLDDYVTAVNGGAGIERHEFSHLDCPLEEDSGHFILAKFVGEDELHLTAFYVPVRHTLYIPGGVIHSNDYLKGTWRTMLSDEADIDHVHLVRGTPPKDIELFKFLFE